MTNSMPCSFCVLPDSAWCTSTSPCPTSCRVLSWGPTIASASDCVTDCYIQSVIPVKKALLAVWLIVLTSHPESVLLLLLLTILLINDPSSLLTASLLKIEHIRHIIKVSHWDFITSGSQKYPWQWCCPSFKYRLWFNIALIQQRI